MRIAQVVNSLEVGGLERLAIDLAVQQKATGHEPFIFCISRRGILADEAERAGIPVIVFGKQAGFSLSVILRLAKELRNVRADLVHTHNALIHHYGALAAKLAGVRVVVNTQHGAGTVHLDKKLAKIYRYALTLTNVVVTVSEETRRYFVDNRGVPGHKSQTIVNGIPLGRFQNRRAQPGVHHPKIVLGTVGRVVPAKDHLTMLEAFHRVRQVYPQAELHLAGEGPLRGLIERRIDELAIGNGVRLYGEILDVPAFLQNLDIFVLSSVTEALPISILEAMAVGLPIVSTDVGGIVEVAPAGHVAEYCRHSSPQDLANALLRVMDSPTLATRGAAAFVHAGKSAGLDRTWAKYEHLFKHLLESAA